MIYLLIIVFGFLFALRGAKNLSLQRPTENFPTICRHMVDLFFALSFLVLSFMAAMRCSIIRDLVRDYNFLFFGILALVFSKGFKKTDVFFLCSSVLAFLICEQQKDLVGRFSLVWAVSVGTALFRTFFLGLRYKILFSAVPEPVKGWPILCLLVSFLSLALWGIGRLIF